VRYLLLLCLAASCAAAEDFSFWIQPCSGQVAEDARCQAADVELAEWALRAWQAAAGGGIRFDRAAEEKSARIRIYWASGRAGLYGEAMPIRVDGKPGAAVYVLPDVSQLGPAIAAASRKDALFRQTVVYLTCLHETGHAIGLPHTADYNDIMYSFAYGGDILDYFSRYRRKIWVREDIRRNSGISASDQARLRKIYSDGR